MTRTLRIGLDARLAARGLGIATYVRELATDLAGLDSVAEVLWFGAEQSAPSLPSIRPLPARWLTRYAAGWLRAHVDVVHFAANTGWLRPGPVPSVVTVHDLIFLANRGRTARQQVGRRYMEFAVPRAVRAATRVIAVSDETAEALRSAHWHDAPTVIPHGVRPVASGPGPSEPYFVMFGGADERKNVKLVLDAFERAFGSGGNGPGLVILAGAGLAADDSERAARLAGVEVRPYVPADAVVDLLHRARALIHPSTQEGFGLPVLEGFAAGTAVIGGLTRVGRRLGGEALIRIDPVDPVASLSAELARLAASPELARAAAAAGLRRAQDFSWRRSAERHAEVYAEAIGRSRG